MSKDRVRYFVQWLVLIASLAMVLKLLTQNNAHASSGPVWKSFTVQEKPAPRN